MSSLPDLFIGIIIVIIVVVIVILGITITIVIVIIVIVIIVIIVIVIFVMMTKVEYGAVGRYGNAAHSGARPGKQRYTRRCPRKLDDYHEDLRINLILVRIIMTIIMRIILSFVIMSGLHKSSNVRINYGGKLSWGKICTFRRLIGTLCVKASNEFSVGSGDAAEIFFLSKGKTALFWPKASDLIRAPIALGKTGIS